MLKTYSYIGCKEEAISVGEKYCLGQLIDTESEEEVRQILESGTMYFKDAMIDIDHYEYSEELLDTVVTVTKVFL